MKLFLTILLCLFIVVPGGAQQKTIRGIVYTIDTAWSFAEGARRYEIDTSNGLAIKVCLLSGKQKEGDICTLGTLTDFDGKFEIQVPEQNTQEYRHIEFIANYAVPIAFELSDNAFDSLNIFHVRLVKKNAMGIPNGSTLGKDLRVYNPPSTSTRAIRQRFPSNTLSKEK